MPVGPSRGLDSARTRQAACCAACRGPGAGRGLARAPGPTWRHSGCQWQLDLSQAESRTGDCTTHWHSVTVTWMQTRSLRRSVTVTVLARPGAPAARGPGPAPAAAQPGQNSELEPRVLQAGRRGLRVGRAGARPRQPHWPDNRQLSPSGPGDRDESEGCRTGPAPGGRVRGRVLRLGGLSGPGRPSSSGGHVN